jgi:ketosteroid isomerase-like protein
VSIEHEILACEAELRQAQLTGDVATLDRLLDDGLVFTSFDGTLASKSDDLALHRSGRLRITRMEPVDRHIVHLGTTSVVSVLMNAAAIVDGAPVTADMRYTRVWHKRPEGWRVVAGHMSAVPAAFKEPDGTATTGSQ